MKPTTFLTYAINKEGNLVHIDSVPNGNKCECICPHCKSALCAKNGGTGEKVVHHFAHLSGADCVGAIESALHKMAKDVMKSCLCLQLPKSQEGKNGGQLNFDRVEVEFYDETTRLRPDCIGFYGDKSIWIEFKRTHAVDTKKKGKIISAKIDCVELDINGCALDFDAVRKFITDETEQRIWIRNTNTMIRYASSAYRYGNDCNRYDDYYSYRKILRTFAKDENGVLVNLSNDEVDMNVHSYYCLVCGNELTIDVDESGIYRFVHIDNDKQCKDEIYLHEAAKEIIFKKFHTENEFSITVPQNQICENKSSCIFYNIESCSKSNVFTYNLKEHGYSECLKDFRLHDVDYKCDLIIIRSHSLRDAIIVIVKTWDNYEDVENGIDIEDYRTIVIEVFYEDVLESLLDSNIGNVSSFHNFRSNNIKTVSGSEINRKILTFRLFSSGKYFLDAISCSDIEKQQKYNKVVLEHTFIQGPNNKQDAKQYSLLKCYKQKRKACFCEICYFLKRTNSNEIVCTRYKTKGTPHYPLQEKSIECSYFILDKKIKSKIEFNYKDVNIIEREYEIS